MEKKKKLQHKQPPFKLKKKPDTMEEIVLRLWLGPTFATNL